MRNAVALVVVASLTAISGTKAQEAISLSAYVDANGFLDIQALTCAQLAGTYQQDADMLMAWYSGWYNGLAKKHYMDYTRGKEAEHEVIMFCKANQDKRIIHAIDIVFKKYRTAHGIKLE